MAWESIVEAVAAATVASVTVATLARRWFRHAVQDVVNESVADVIRRLDRQAVRLARIERKLGR